MSGLPDKPPRETLTSGLLQDEDATLLGRDGRGFRPNQLNGGSWGLELLWVMFLWLPINNISTSPTRVPYGTQFWSGSSQGLGEGPQPYFPARLALGHTDLAEDGRSVAHRFSVVLRLDG